jgi:hypothetical protein
LHLPEIPFVKGVFKLYVYLLGDDGLHIYDTRILDDAFTVEYEKYPFGIVSVQHEWIDLGSER